MDNSGSFSGDNPKDPTTGRVVTDAKETDPSGRTVTDSGQHGTDYKHDGPFTLDELLIAYSPNQIPGFPLPHPMDRTSVKIRTVTVQVDVFIVGMPKWDDWRYVPTDDEKAAFRPGLTSTQAEAAGVYLYSNAPQDPQAVSKLAKAIAPKRLYWQGQEIV